MATSTPVATAIPGAPPASRRSSKLLIGLAIAVGLAAVAAAAYTFVPRFMNPTSDAAAPAKVAAPEKPIFLMLEPLTVNLQSEGRARFLQIGMALRLPDEQTKAQIVEYMPELRSRLLMLLSNRTPDTLVTPEGKARLAEEIRNTLNTPLAVGQPPLGISNVSFNTFVVQ